MGNNVGDVLQMAITAIMATGGLYAPIVGSALSTDDAEVKSDKDDNEIIIDADGYTKEELTNVEETPRLTSTSSEGNN